LFGFYNYSRYFRKSIGKILEMYGGVGPLYKTFAAFSQVPPEVMSIHLCEKVGESQKRLRKSAHIHFFGAEEIDETKL